MANQNCSACEDLRQTDPNLIVNGFTDTECTSLKNDTGLVASSGHNDCTDLNNLNDCLVGNMETELDAYDVCDWKEFMKKFIPNVWTTLKGIICAICGIWTNVHNLWKLANRIDCLIDYMMNGASFHFSETSTDTASYIVAGKGVSFANVSASGTASDVAITYIAGGVARVTGSCLLYTANFTDRIAGYNYDSDGVNPVKSASRQGNSIWNDENTKPGGYNSELMYEIRIKKSEFPQIKAIFSNNGLNSEGGAFHVSFMRRSEGQYAPGQHGACDATTGDPVHSGDSRGHLVPDGWTYLQCRMTWIDKLGASASGSQITPNGLIGIRMNQDAIDC